MKRTNTAVWLEKYNRWQINVQKDGRRRSFFSSAPGRTGQREANAKADAWLEGDVVDGKQRTQNTYGEFLAAIASKEEQKKAEQFGRLYILPTLGRKRVATLTEDDFQTILEKAAQKGVSGNPLSHKTLSILSATMKSFIKFCRRKKLTTETLEFLTIPQGAKKGIKRILQPKDLNTLMTIPTTILWGKRVPDDYIHAYRFAVLTGVRPGELRGLERSDIRGRRVQLQRSLNQDSEVTTGKNENARRSFFLGELAKEELDAQLASHTEQRVFPIESQSTFRHRWKRYCEANGIPYISPYEFRHTFVSIAKNLPEGKLKAIVGHSRNMDTFGVYGHEVQGELQDTALQLDGIFSELLASQTRIRKPTFSSQVYKSVFKSVLFKNKEPA